MKRTCLFHISGNIYPPFPATHHTRHIWDEIAKGFDEYHIIARGTGCCYIHSIDGSMHLHLLPAFSKRMWPFFFLSWVLPWFVFRYRPTHILAQCPVLGGLAAAVCAKIFNIPLFVELHGTHYFWPSRPGWKGRLEHIVYRVVSRQTFRAASRIRSLSEVMCKHFHKIYGDNAHRKVVVVPNRVDLGIFHSVKNCYSINGPINIVSVGNFSQIKNHLALISDLAKIGIEFKLTLVGSGALQETYEKLAESLNLSGRINCRSLEHRDLAELLPKFDIYIHYSHSEGVPRAILEAMAVGLPVISTHVGFIDGILCNSENAIVIELPYGDGLFKAIRVLLNSEELRCQLGVAARKTIVERFEWKVVFEQYRAAILSMS